uniref:3-hydroxyacyl-CoA dehydrogenase n=1 Tax=Romanomermis culicivorax TaxID=13658 RepID=A0A915J438_ROMCU
MSTKCHVMNALVAIYALTSSCFVVANLLNTSLAGLELFVVRAWVELTTPKLTSAEENGAEDAYGHIDIFPAQKGVTCYDTNRLTETTELYDCISDATIILENLPENLPLKQKVFEAIDNYFSSFHNVPSVIVGSSSSTFSASDVSRNLKILKSRFMIIHPVNPSTYCKLVELVPSKFTDMDAMDEAYRVMKNLGQIPVKMKKDVPGFALNRLQVALIMECWKLVNQGVISVADLHVAVTEGLAPLHIFFSSFEIGQMDGDGIENFMLKSGNHITEVLETSTKQLNLDGERCLFNVKEEVETICIVLKTRLFACFCQVNIRVAFNQKLEVTANNLPNYGIIGRQWAVLFLKSGYQVWLYGRNEERLEEARLEIAALIEKGKTSTEKSLIDLLTTTTSLKDCIQNAAVIIENLLENLPLKLEVLKQIEKILSTSGYWQIQKESIIIGSSTSTFPAKELCKGLVKLKDRFMIIHPINPPTHCKLVELVQSSFTAKNAIEGAYDLMKSIGQKPIIMKKDVPGFALNRLQLALVVESWRLVTEGVVSVEDLSTVMTEGLAPRYIFYGPFEVGHMNANGIEDYMNRYSHGISDTLETFGPTPNFENKQDLDMIKLQLEIKVPTDKVTDIRIERDSKLDALAKFKKQFTCQISSYFSHTISLSCGQVLHVLVLHGGALCSNFSSGVIGRQWAVLFLGAGFDVRMHDVSSEQLDIAVVEISKLLKQLEDDGLARSSLSVGDQLKRLHVTNSLIDCLNGAVYVQESVPEQLDQKIKLWEQIDQLLTTCNLADIKSVILASSSSTLQPCKIVDGLPNMKNRFLVAHPINPPMYCRLVELVPSSYADQDLMESAFLIMKKLGQAPIRVNKDVKGFVLNRLQYTLLAQCWHLIADDAISMEDLNTVITEGLAPRYAFYGPLEVVHMNADGIEDFVHKYGKAVTELSKTFGPVPDFKDKNMLKKLKDELEAKVPLDKLRGLRANRDRKLAAFEKFKMQGL